MFVLKIFLQKLQKIPLSKFIGLAFIIPWEFSSGIRPDISLLNLPGHFLISFFWSFCWSVFKSLQELRNPDEWFPSISCFRFVQEFLHQSPSDVSAQISLGNLMTLFYAICWSSCRTNLMIHQEVLASEIHPRLFLIRFVISRNSMRSFCLYTWKFSDLWDILRSSAWH